jgi:hypothetical protein
MTPATRVAARFRVQILSQRVAARYVEAFEFSSPKEREKYLKEHPKADPSRHTVKEKEERPGAKPEEKGDKRPKAKPEEPDSGEGKDEETDEKPEKGKEPAPKPEAKKPSFLNKLKGVTEKARSALTNSPKAVQKFFSDDAHRRKVMQSLHKSMTEAPEKYAKKLIETAKHEVHEFKEAGGAIRDVLKGKKLSDKQKKAVKTVAIHMGITLAAAALTSTGVLAGAAAAGQAMAKHIALKAAANALGQLHVMEEVGHVGHGVLDIMSKFAKEKEDPEEVLAALVMKAVQEELENLDDEALVEILNSMGETPATKEAAAPAPSTLIPLLEQAETVHKRLRAWIREFPMVLRMAQQEALATNLEGTGLVWQDRLTAYWRELDQPNEVLESIDEQINQIYNSHPRMAVQDVANLARDATAWRLQPKKAMLEYAFGNPQFRNHPDRRDHIAYEVSRLEEWAGAFEKWTEDSIQNLRKGVRKTRRLV